MLTLANVSHWYGHLRVLSRVNLHIDGNHSLGISGPSGSGKSTLARILTLHERPSAGAVLLDGVVPEARARRKLQLVWQDPADAFHPAWPAWRIAAEAWQIGEGPRPDHRMRAAELLNAVHLPSTALDRRADELSGGQRRRLAIARALAANPRLLVLDESLTGLEDALQASIVELLLALQAERGLALVIVSHQRSVLRSICREVLSL